MTNQIEILLEARERVWDTMLPAETCRTIEEYLDGLIEELR